MKKTLYTVIAVVLVLIIAAVCVLQNDSLRYSIRDMLGFPRYVYYVNNVPQYDIDQLDFANNDVREVQINKERSYLVNHSRGFALGFPADAQYDFSAAQEFIKVSCSDFSAVISKEYTTYGPTVEDSKKYVNEVLHKYMLDEKYIEENNITVHKNDMEEIAGFPMQILALTRTPAKGSEEKDNTYVYCYIYNEDIMFYRIMFKSSEYSDQLMNEVYNTLNSFSTNVAVKGISDTFTDYKPVLNENWNDKTKELYEELSTSDSCKWGIFTPWAVFQNNYSDITALENKVGTEFDGVLEYIHHTDKVPVDGMKSAFDDGKIVELTLQTSTIMNENLNGHNPMFDVLDGQCDDLIRGIARDIRDLEHPVLFRLNNEMNSDWTSYSASACLTDPEIYIKVWRRVYNIFEDEGVKNAIWVFNPNDISFPPNGYNTSLAYYPGNGYVHMFGITGYNTGTYYLEEHGEKWRTFDEIYTHITENSQKDYGEFPWVITEFASSSYGGDKAQWIEDMFSSMKNYPNIKMAFWFNSADYDVRAGKEDIAARPYWFDETAETTKAFAKGLRQQ